MQPSFVAHEADPRALEAIKVLKSLGHKTEIISNGSIVAAGAIAIFSLADTKDLSFPGRVLRMVPWHFNSVTPEWAQSTPFRIALRKQSVRRKGVDGFREALKVAAAGYSEWELGSSRSPAPWHVNPLKPTGHQVELGQWVSQAHVALGDSTPFQILGAYLEPIYGYGSRVDSLCATPAKLLVMGCAPFNRPHTDVVDKLDPLKSNRAAHYLASLATDMKRWVNEIVYISADEDFLFHPALRASLHPFLFMDTAEIPDTGKAISGQRLWGREHRRSDNEIAEALRAGAKAQADIVGPLRGAGITVREYTWTQLFGTHLLDVSWTMAQQQLSIAKRIYHDRVRTHEFYDTLDRFLGSAAGLTRTLGNIAIYIATAMFLKENPEHLVVDAEVDRQFWTELDCVIRPIWTEGEPYIGTPPQAFRQPWGY